MGIPVPTRRAESKSPSPTSSKYGVRNPRVHNKMREDALDFESEGSVPGNHVEDAKRPSEVSRMGNYFNIVIAPPPIKALQPRKMLSEAFRPPGKRI